MQVTSHQYKIDRSTNIFTMINIPKRFANNICFRPMIFLTIIKTKKTVESNNYIMIVYFIPEFLTTREDDGPTSYFISDQIFKIRCHYIYKINQ